MEPNGVSTETNHREVRYHRFQGLSYSAKRKALEILRWDGIKISDLYVDLRRILARQPGNEAREQLRIYAQGIEEKKAKSIPVDWYKVMQSELKLYQTKVYPLQIPIPIKINHQNQHRGHDYKYKIERLQKEQQMVKLDYQLRDHDWALWEQSIDFQRMRTGTMLPDDLGAQQNEPMQDAADLPLPDNEEHRQSSSLNPAWDVFD